MKTKLLAAGIGLLFLFSASIMSFHAPTATDTALTGSWQSKSGSAVTVLSFVDNYFVCTSFDPQQKKFGYTWGGPYRLEGGRLQVTVQFDTRNASIVGKTQLLGYQVKERTLSGSFTGEELTYQQIDEARAPLAGVWRISGRKQGDAIAEMPLGARRTLKVLTGTRFQWTAINIETGAFSGTGGGRYQFENGRYIELIEFFSRDSSRVGAVLSFDGKLENGDWHHSGLSSKGDPIYERWSRLSH